MQVSIIGLGRAAWIYDLENSNLRRSHTQSIQEVSGFDVVAGVDVSKNVATAWSSHFGIPAFSNLEEMFGQFEPDLIVISVPIADLFNTLMSVLNFTVHAYILIEKPVISSNEQYLQLLSLQPEEKNRIIVNLPRLFSTETFLLANALQGQEDSLIQLSGSYSGSLLNTSLHFISLIDSLVPRLEWRLINSNNYIISREDSARKHELGSIFHDSSLDTSTFDFRIAGRQFQVDYRDGGNQISLFRNERNLPIKSTRNTYQKNVYDYISINGMEKAAGISGLNKVLSSISGMISHHEY